MQITRTSIVTGITRQMDLPVTECQMAMWLQHDVLIQDALPHLTTDQREWLISGITPEEWATHYGD